MTDSPRRYSLDDELKRGYPEKPILKEEQKKILEKLLDIDRSRLSPEEQLLMEKLVGQLESDSHRVKEIRKRIEGRGSISELIALLQQDRESFRKPPTQTPEKPPPEGIPSTPEPPSRERETEAKQQQTSPPRSGRPFPFSEQPVARPPARPQRLPKPKPWKEIVEKRPPEAPPVAKVQEAPEPAKKKSPRPAPITQPDQARPSRQEEPLAPAPPDFSPQEPGPVDVVERYVKAWNVKAFAAEYECFSPSFIEMTKEAYVDRRMATYLAYNRDGQFVQRMGTVLKTHVDRDHAEVLCTRSVREFRKSNIYLDLYILRKENGQWRITGVTTEIAQLTGVSRVSVRRALTPKSSSQSETA